MAQRTLTIDLPGSTEALQRALQMLLHYGLISEQKMHAIKLEETIKKTHKKSRWTKAAERFEKENYLKGRSGEVKKLFQEFRDDFEL